MSAWPRRCHRGHPEARQQLGVLRPDGRRAEGSNRGSHVISGGSRARAKDTPAAESPDVSPSSRRDRTPGHPRHPCRCRARAMCLLRLDPSVLRAFTRGSAPRGRTLRMTPDCFRILPDTSGCFRILPNTSEYFRMLPNTSECFRILPNASGRQGDRSAEAGDLRRRRKITMAARTAAAAPAIPHPPIPRPADARHSSAIRSPASRPVRV